MDLIRTAVVTPVTSEMTLEQYKVLVRKWIDSQRSLWEAFTILYRGTLPFDHKSPSILKHPKIDSKRFLDHCVGLVDASSEPANDALYVIYDDLSSDQILLD